MNDMRCIDNKIVFMRKKVLVLSMHPACKRTIIQLYTDKFTITNYTSSNLAPPQRVFGREASPCRNWRVLVTSAPCVEQRIRSRTLYRYGAYVETWRDFVLDVLHIRSIMTNAQEETTADEVRKNTLRSGFYGQHLWCH